MDTSQIIFVSNMISTGVVIGVFVGYSRTQFAFLKQQIEELKGTTQAIQNISERLAVVEKCTDHNATNLDDLRRVVDRRYASQKSE